MSKYPRKSAIAIKRAKEALQESIEHLQLAAKAAEIGTYTYDFTSGKRYWSPELLAHWGFPDEEPEYLASGNKIFDIIHEEDRESVMSALDAADDPNKNGMVDVEFRIKRSDGSIRWLQAHGRNYFSGKGKNRKPYKSYGAMVDITKLKLAEENLGKLNRTLKALSDCSQSMIHASSESAYLNDICRIIVDDCGYRLVWIGIADNDIKKSVYPVAYAGFNDGYIRDLNITWDDSERGRGPTGTAIRTGKPYICRDMHTDPNFLPWRKEAIKRGYTASMVVPLIFESRPIGALTIYSNEASPFDNEEEVKLFTELANNTAFGINTIRLKLKDKLAEGILKRDKETLDRIVQERTLELLAAHNELDKAKRRKARGNRCSRTSQPAWGDTFGVGEH